MTDLSYPGVYTEEVPGKPGPITGASTSILGLLGWTPKGLVGEPIIATSYPEFESKAGSFNSKSITNHEAYAFFANGGQILYFVRAVHDDAVASYYDLVKTMTSAEVVSDTAQGSGIYSLELDTVPVSPSSLTLTFGNATPANQNVFTDDGEGNLVFDSENSGASASGGSGSIDYTTGEISVTLSNPGQYVGGGQDITAQYGYVLYRFQMKWEGAAGDMYRVRITPGSDDYLVQEEARWTRFDVLVDENVGTVSVPSWVTRETFTNLSFDDSESSDFLATVINADSGSSTIEIVDYGNNENPQALQGTSVANEDISSAMAPSDGSAGSDYDGSIKGWTYTLDNGAFENTFSASFTFNDGVTRESGTDDTSVGAATMTDTTASFVVDGLIGYVIRNITDGSWGIITDNTETVVTATLVGGTGNEWDSGDEYEIIETNVKIGVAGTPAAATATVESPGSVTAPAAITPGSVVIKTELTTAGDVLIVDDGAGTLYDGTAGSAGTIDYTTGVISELDVSGVTAWAADTFAAGASIEFACRYASAVKIEDDADGVLSLATTQATGWPQKFGLNSAVVNSIDYDDGTFTVTWKINGEPTHGPGGATVQVASYYTQPDPSISGQMENGDDGSDVDSGDVVDPTLAIDGSGLYAFDKTDVLMQLVVADFQTDTYVQDALLTYCELKKDKFAIMTVPYGLTYQEAETWKKFQLNRYSSYGALYYPHIKVRDPLTKVNIDIPTGGHVAGIYARTDSDFNVSTAPAGMGRGDIRWSTGLEVDLTKTQCGILNKANINCLIQWPETGRVVWGARTIDAAGGEWPYIQMRRLFMFLEKSVYNAANVHVFKNNGPDLWTAIRTQVSTFLGTLFDSGYFSGDTAEQAYFVICDRTNNSQSTVDQGIVYCDVGVAPTKPGEFIVFRFAQITQ